MKEPSFSPDCKYTECGKCRRCYEFVKSMKTPAIDPTFEPWKRWSKKDFTEYRDSIIQMIKAPRTQEILKIINKLELQDFGEEDYNKITKEEHWGFNVAKGRIKQKIRELQ